MKTSWCRNVSVIAACCWGLLIPTMLHAAVIREVEVTVADQNWNLLPGATVAYRGGGHDAKAITAGYAKWLIRGADEKLVMNVSHPEAGDALVQVVLNNGDRDNKVELLVLLGGKTAQVEILGRGSSAQLHAGTSQKVLRGEPEPLFGRNRPTVERGPGTCGGGGDCCTATPGVPGCSDIDCCTTICTCDPFCCDVEWDSFCAGSGFEPGCGAAILCSDICGGGGPCDVVCDPGATPEGEPDCGLPTDTVNGGCNSAPPVFTSISCGDTYCGTGAFDGATRDTDWYKVVLPSATTVTWTAESEFDLLVGIVNNFGIDSCAGVGAFLAFATAGPCTPTPVTACLPAGTWYLFVAPQFTAPVTCGAEYEATLTCAPCVTGACCLPNGSCIVASSDDCLAQGGTYQGDDVPCAPGLCPAPMVCGPGNGDCCTANGTPGCDDTTCCTAICAIDPFCCDVAWDGICADEADADDLNCPACMGAPVCGPGAGDCCVSNGSPGCDDTDCCEAICAIDPFCCDVTWDGICADEAAAEPLCDCGGGGICGMQGGDCCTATPGTAGCMDATCCSAICAIDPFCCNVEWDQICADEAAADAINCPACAGPPCDVTCPPGSTPEGEPNCGLPTDTVNGGCNSTPPVFSPISCGQTYCGTGAFDGATRDTDWYKFVTPPGGTAVNWSVEAEFNVLVGVVDNFGIDSCAGVTSFLVFALGADCTPTSVSTCLPEGTWYLFVAPDFAGIVPCGAEYSATLTCGPCGSGACCLSDGTCIPDISSAACSAQGGNYQGDLSVCSPGLCPVGPGNDNCGGAETVAIPSATAGSTVGANIDGGLPPPCGNGAGITAPGVWYHVVGTGNTITANTCVGSNYDTQLSVFCPSCAAPTCVTDNDDFCGLQSQVSWCAQSGADYYILVHGFGAATGNFTLTLSQNAIPCTPTVQCTATGGCCVGGNCTIQSEDACNMAGGDYLGDNTTCDVPGNSYVDNPNLAIPDNVPAGVSDMMNVPDSFSITDVNVDLVINHTWVGDLVVTLNHGATTVVLVNMPGDPDDIAGSGGSGGFGCGSDNYNVILDDEGPGGPIETLCSGTMNSPPNYTPNNPLSAFDGADAAGTWTINVADTAGADVGTLVQWSLHFPGAGSVCTPVGACCNYPDCTIETEADCLAAGGDYQGDDTVCSTPGMTTVHNDSPNAAIPDNLPAGISDSMNVADAGNVVDLNVDLVITHTWVGDLEVRLSNGTVTATLVRMPGDATDQPGSPGTFGCSSDNYGTLANPLVLDDEGAGGTVEALCSPSMISPPNYTPNNPLSAFDGEPIAGTWTITVVDTAGGDTGTLVQWSLHFTGPGMDTCVFTGACCNRDTGVCLEDQLEADCDALANGDWYEGTPCSEVNPPCQVCGNGIVEGTEECDEGAANGTATSCCDSDCTYSDSSKVCRAQNGDCDVAEMCTGSSEDCPDDGYAPSSQVCRPVNGGCDIADNCSGMGPDCPPNSVRPQGFVCRAEAGDCDIAEECDGTAKACPPDAVEPNSTVCRPSLGVCDPPESCNGTGVDCPGDVLDNTTVCRPAADVCDVDDACDGSGPDCPADAVAAAGTVCRDAVDECDIVEECDGVGTACPADDVITECISDDGCCPVECGGPGRSNDNDCPPKQIPTVSEWGLVVMTLLLLAGWKAYFGRRRTAEVRP